MQTICLLKEHGQGSAEGAPMGDGEPPPREPSVDAHRGGGVCGVGTRAGWRPLGAAIGGRLEGAQGVARWPTLIEICLCFA